MSKSRHGQPTYSLNENLGVSFVIPAAWYSLQYTQYIYFVSYFCIW